MINIYKRLVSLLLVVTALLFDGAAVQAQQVSGVPGGYFEEATSWVNGVPNQTYNPLTISANSEIVRNQDLSWGAKVIVNGVLRINGNYSVGYGGTIIDGSLVVANGFQVGGGVVINNHANVMVGGFFNGTGGVSVGDNVVLEVGGAFNGTGGVSFGSNAAIDIPGDFVSAGGLNIGDESDIVVGGNFSIGGGSTANIRGQVQINGSLVGGGSNFIIHNGATVSVSNVDANMSIEVRDGGTLIVEGGYKNGQDLTVREGGLVEVRGTEGFNANGALINYGTMIVAGDYVNNSGGVGLSVLGRGFLDIGGDLVANKGVRVDPHAVLLVRGSVYYDGGQSGMFIDGTMIVAEDFNIRNGNISATGKVVVGGTFEFDGGGFSVVDQHGSGEANLYLLDGDAPHSFVQGGQNVLDKKTGGIDDFVSHEQDELLWDLVSSVLPEWVAPGSSSREFKWVGAQNTQWSDRRNWNGLVPPVKVSVVVQAGTYSPLIAASNGLVEVKNITLETGSTLTLNPGAKLTINGSLEVADEGALIMKNTTEVGGLSSLLVHGGIGGDALTEGAKGEVTIELEFPYDEWYYVSQPIKDAKSDIYGIWNEDDSFSTTEGWVNIHRANRWYRIGGGVDIAQLEGVSSKYKPADGTNYVISYVGKLNNEPIARSYSNRQYYLFGNPYPSSINWQDDAGWERNNIGGTIWYRTRVNGVMTFVTYNRNVDPGGRAAIYPDGAGLEEEIQLALIPPLQSVWMASLGASSVSVTNEARLHVPEGSFLKSRSAGPSNVLRITAENATGRDGAVLYFSPNAQEGIEQGDSEKMFNEPIEIPEVYTRVGAMALAINGLPVLEESSRVIPLSVRNRIEGEVTLHFDLQYYSGTHVPYLEDSGTGTFINLLQDQSYSYEVKETGENHDRFSLHFFNVTTDIVAPKEDEVEAGGSISIKNISDKVLISVGMDILEAGNGVIEIYTIDGRKVSEVIARSSRTLVFLPSKSGIYIVRAQFGDKVNSERMLIGKN